MKDGSERGFLDYMVASIDEDIPRLVYADWLQEQGRDERAEFIRVQVDRARLPSWDPAQVPLRLREAELLKKYGEEWLAEMPKVEGARWEGFRRGIVAEVSFASFEAMRKSAAACRAVAPVEAVTVRWPRRREAQKVVKPIAELRELTITGTPTDEAFEWLAQSPQMATLRKLTMRGVWGFSLREFLTSPHLANLRSLRLPACDINSHYFRHLADSASLTALEELDLTAAGRHERYNSDETIRAAGMQTLMGWSGMATVRSLTLSGNNLTADGLRALLRSPHVAALKELSLRDTRLTGQAMAEFESAHKEMRLDTLDIGQNVLKAVGAEYLAVVPCLSELKSLRLDRCEITAPGARLFAKKATFIGSLRILDIANNHFGPSGLQTLLEREPAVLHTLRMRDNDLYVQGAELLAASPASDNLLELDLSQNNLGAEAAKALGESEHLRDLLVLRVADNAIPESAAAELANSPLGKRLAELEQG